MVSNLEIAQKILEVVKKTRKNQPVPEEPTQDETVNDVIRLLISRSNQGMETYGTTMKDNPLSAKEWIDHAIEESLDHACYLMRLKDEISEKATKT